MLKELVVETHVIYEGFYLNLREVQPDLFCSLGITPPSSICGDVDDVEISLGFILPEDQFAPLHLAQHLHEEGRLACLTRAAQNGKLLGRDDFGDDVFHAF